MGFLCFYGHKGAQSKKIFYADDGSGGRKLDGLLEWWKEEAYFLEATKTWLVVNALYNKILYHPYTHPIPNTLDFNIPTLHFPIATLHYAHHGMLLKFILFFKKY